MKTVTLIFLLFVAGCITDDNGDSTSGKSVYGEIISVDGIGVEGITVEIMGVEFSKSDTTSTEGLYNFNNVENGEYTIKFISDKYSFAFDELIIINEDEEYEVPRNIASRYLEVYYAISDLRREYINNRSFPYELNVSYTMPNGDQKIIKSDTYSKYSWETPKFKFPDGEYIEFVVEKLNFLTANRPEIFIYVNDKIWRSKRFQKDESVIRLYGIIH